MIQLRILIAMVIIMNIFGLFVMIIHSYINKAIPENSTLLSTRNPYRFDNPLLAYHILRKLERFESVDDSYYNTLLRPKNQYDVVYLGIDTEKRYCDKVRGYFVDHSDQIFYERNFFTDFLPESLSRRIIKQIGYDVHPNINEYMPKEQKTKRVFPLNANIDIFFFSIFFHLFGQVGENFACLSQEYNHIPGVGTLNRKDLVVKSWRNYSQDYINRQECLDTKLFMPETFILQDKQECKNFFKYIKSKEYQLLKNKQTTVFIRKYGLGSHKGLGINLVDKAEEAALKGLYNSGKKCGELENNIIIQKYIPNPLLVEGHKFDFRIYMLIASTNPLIAYYHDGFLRLSLYEYDQDSTEKGVHLTNTEISNVIFDKAKKDGWNGMNETELRNFQMWSFAKFENYLLMRGIVKDSNWLNNYLRPKIKKAMIHLLRMTQHAYLKRSSLYELFGVDFILDDNLNLWFLECNSSPVLKGTSEEKEQFVTKMLIDHFEVVISYLRSRMKRVINYVNLLIRDEYAIENKFLDGVYISEIEIRCDEFANITKNYLEPEFELGLDNGFSLIIDENKQNAEKYANFIDTDCL